MEIRVVLRGAAAGFIAGLLGFVFARIFAEPVIDRAIDFESGRDDMLAKLGRAAGLAVAPDDPGIFSRSIQTSIGVASGIVAFATAMGALVAVAYLVLHGRFRVRPAHLAWMIAGFGFLGVYLLPFVKYPANPPSIGHTFTITTRGHLYLAMVGASLALLGLAAYLARRLTPSIGASRAVLASAAAFLVLFGVLIAVLPSLGDLAANKAHAGQLGYSRSATETPGPVVNVLSTPLTVDGKTFAPGQIAYPGFDPDLLWKFRWYSIINQLLIWTVIGVTFGAMLERYLVPKPSRRASDGVDESIPVLT